MIKKETPTFSPGKRALLFSVALLASGFAALYLRVRYPGLHPQVMLFVWSIPANSAISVFSHEVALLDYGSHQPVLFSALTATLGTIVAGWLDWHVFVPLLNTDKMEGYRANRVYRYCIDQFERAPFIVIIVTGFTPIPFFPFKFLAFSVKYPLWKYLAAVTIARFPRYYLLAWLGESYHFPKWVLATLLLAIFLPACWELFRGRGEVNLRKDKR